MVRMGRERILLTILLVTLQTGIVSQPGKTQLIVGPECGRPGIGLFLMHRVARETSHFSSLITGRIDESIEFAS